MVEIQYAQLNEEMQENVDGWLYTESDLLSVGDSYSRAKTLITNNAPPNYISFDGNGIDLNDNEKVFYSEGDYVGFISSDVSDEDCHCTSENIYLTYNDGYLNFDNGITISFYGDCCSELTVQHIFPDTTSEFETYTVDGELFHFVPGPWYSDCTHSMRIYFNKSKLPNQFIKVSYIKFGNVVVWNKLKDISMLEEINILSDDLPMNSLNFSVVLKEDFEFKDGSPMNVYSNGRYYGTFYLDEAERISKKIYSVKSLNSIGILENTEYKEWKMSSNFTTFKNEIKSLTDVSITHPDGNYTAFGNIPINSCRYALCLYAFACRFMIDSSRNDGIVLKNIPEVIKSVITTDDKRIIGEATYTKSKPIASAKMQYALSYTGDTALDTIQLNNPANERVLYYFDEPVDVADDQPNGVTIYSKADNYVDFVSDTDNVSLNVYKIGYTYNNVNIINDSAVNTKSNEKDFSKLNLRGGTYPDGGGIVTQLTELKAQDILKFIKSGGTVKAKIVLVDEKVGDLIQIETAFDGVKTGIITSMAISFGYRDVADIEVLEWSVG